MSAVREPHVCSLAFLETEPQRRRQGVDADLRNLKHPEIRLSLALLFGEEQLQADQHVVAECRPVEEAQPHVELPAANPSVPSFFTDDSRV